MAHNDRWDEDRERRGLRSQGRWERDGAEGYGDAAGVHQERSFMPQGGPAYGRGGPAHGQGQPAFGERETGVDYTRNREATGGYAPRTGDVFGQRETGVDYGVGPGSYSQDRYDQGPRGRGPGQDHRDTQWGGGAYGRRDFGPAPQEERYGSRPPSFDRQADRGDRFAGGRGSSHAADHGRSPYDSGPYENTGHTNERDYGRIPDAEAARIAAYGGFGGYGEGAGGSYAGGQYGYARGPQGQADSGRGEHPSGRGLSRHQDGRHWWDKAADKLADWVDRDDRSGDYQSGSHRGRGPKGYTRSDERIRDEAHEHLTYDTLIDATHIEVEVSGGEITLSGSVDSREAKRRAERLVEDLWGVKHVQNNLRVQSPSTTGQRYGDDLHSGLPTHGSVLGAQTDGEAGDDPDRHDQANLSAGGAGQTTGRGPSGAAASPTPFDVTQAAHQSSAEGKSNTPNAADAMNRQASAGEGSGSLGPKGTPN